MTGWFDEAYTFRVGGRRGGKGNTATFAIIPAGEAIPPCLDAGWAAPDWDAA